jgi:quinol monooxygenase YgiN
MIILTGYLQLDPADVAAFTVAMQAVAASTRAEPGCLFYGMAWEDAAAGRMLVAQRWRDQVALDAHLETPTTQAFLQAWGERMRADIDKHDASSERPLAP